MNKVVITSSTVTFVEISPLSNIIFKYKVTIKPLFLIMIKEIKFMLKSRRDRKYLKEELLEVVGHMADDVDDQGWQEGGQDDAQQSPLDRHLVVNVAEKS